MYWVMGIAFAFMLAICLATGGRPKGAAAVAFLACFFMGMGGIAILVLTDGRGTLDNAATASAAIPVAEPPIEVAVVHRDCKKIPAKKGFPEETVCADKVPEDQQRVREELNRIIAVGHDKYRQAGNDFMAEAAARERNAELDNIAQYCCRDWEGYVQRVYKKPDGSAAILVSWGGFYFLNVTQKMPPGTPAFDILSQYYEYMRIRFTGHIVLHDRVDAENVLADALDFEFTSILVDDDYTTPQGRHRS